MTDAAKKSQAYDEVVEQLTDDDPWKITLPFIKHLLIDKLSDYTVLWDHFHRRRMLLKIVYESRGSRFGDDEVYIAIVRKHLEGYEYPGHVKEEIALCCGRGYRHPDQLHCHIIDAIVIASTEHQCWPDERIIGGAIKYEDVPDLLPEGDPWRITLPFLKPYVFGNLFIMNRRLLNPIARNKISNYL
jgi:hypothetical protein